MNHARRWLLVASFLVVAAAPAAAQGNMGLNVSLYSGEVVAVTPAAAFGVGPVSGDVIGLDATLNGKLGSGYWGWFVGGAYGIGSEKFTDPTGSLELKINTIRLRGGVQAVWNLSDVGELRYGPGLEYSTTKAEFDDGTTSLEGEGFTTISIGADIDFASGRGEGMGLYGGLSSYVGRGSAEEAGEEYETIVFTTNYRVGIRFNF